MKVTKTQLNKIRKYADLSVNIFDHATVSIRVRQDGLHDDLNEELVISYPREKAQHGNIADARSLAYLQEKIKDILGVDTGALWFGFQEDSFELWTTINK